MLNYELVILGSGSAWCVPEHSCSCAICTAMRQRGELRTRTSLLVKGPETILVDCSPDVRLQMSREEMKRPDVVLITHEHGDHFLGLDDLLAFRRSMPRESWRPIPVYASEQAWKAIEVRFGYLIGSLLEKRIAVPGLPLDGTITHIVPFKTFHGDTAPGSLGYVMDVEGSDTRTRVVYTSDFMSLDKEPDILMEPDILILQAHWFNEPCENRPSHMSFQNGIDYIKRWKPRNGTYLVHISDGDLIPGDPCNNFLKKLPPIAPFCSPSSGNAYPVPRCAQEWQERVDKVCKDYQVPGPVVVTHDGMSIALQRSSHSNIHASKGLS